jgi:hypothetical protein
VSRRALTKSQLLATRTYAGYFSNRQHPESMFLEADMVSTDELFREGFPGARRLRRQWGAFQWRNMLMRALPAGSG